MLVSEIKNNFNVQWDEFYSGENYEHFYCS